MEANKFPLLDRRGGCATKQYCEATEAGTDGRAKPASPIGRSNKEMVVLTPTKNSAGNVSTTPSAPGEEGKFPRFYVSLGKALAIAMLFQNGCSPPLPVT